MSTRFIRSRSMRTQHGAAGVDDQDAAAVGLEHHEGDGNALDSGVARTMSRTPYRVLPLALWLVRRNAWPLSPPCEEPESAKGKPRHRFGRPHNSGAAPGRDASYSAAGAFAGVRGPWPANRCDKSSLIVAAPGMFSLLAVLTDW